MRPICGLVRRNGFIGCDAFARAILVKARDNAVRRRDKRRQRVVTKMINGTRRFDLFSGCTV